MSARDAFPSRECNFARMMRFGLVPLIVCAAASAFADPPAKIPVEAVLPEKPSSGDIVRIVAGGFPPKTSTGWFEIRSGDGEDVFRVDEATGAIYVADGVKLGNQPQRQFELVIEHAAPREGERTAKWRFLLAAGLSEKEACRRLGWVTEYRILLKRPPSQTLELSWSRALASNSTRVANWYRDVVKEKFANFVVGLKSRLLRATMHYRVFVAPKMPARTPIPRQRESALDRIGAVVPKIPEKTPIPPQASETPKHEAPAAAVPDIEEPASRTAPPKTRNEQSLFASVWFQGLLNLTAVALAYWIYRRQLNWQTTDDEAASSESQVEDVDGDAEPRSGEQAATDEPRSTVWDLLHAWDPAPEENAFDNQFAEDIEPESPSEFHDSTSDEPPDRQTLRSELHKKWHSAQSRPSPIFPPESSENFRDEDVALEPESAPRRSLAASSATEPTEERDLRGETASSGPTPEEMNTLFALLDEKYGIVREATEADESPAEWDEPPKISAPAHEPAETLSPEAELSSSIAEYMNNLLQKYSPGDASPQPQADTNSTQVQNTAETPPPSAELPASNGPSPKTIRPEPVHQYDQEYARTQIEALRQASNLTAAHAIRSATSRRSRKRIGRIVLFCVFSLIALTVAKIYFG